MIESDLRHSYQSDAKLTSSKFMEREIEKDAYRGIEMER